MFSEDELTSGPVIKEPPQQDYEEYKCQRILENKLGTQCPIEEPSIRRMSEPAVSDIRMRQNDRTDILTRIHRGLQADGFHVFETPQNVKNLSTRES
jgi:hypothetical protein